MGPSHPAPLLITLEFARARAAEDPYAFAEGLQAYLLREAGGVYDGFEICWDEALNDDLAWLARPCPPAEVVGRMGERLRQILLLAGWECHDREIGEAVASGRRVIVDVLSAAAELYSLPWELVPLRSTGHALAELPQVLIRYAWPATSTVGSPAPPEGGRVLFAWSDAAGPVPWQAQEVVLREAVAVAGALAPVGLDVLPRATPESLIAALAARPAVLHLLCHGRGGVRGGLLLSSEIPGGPDRVDPARLGQILAPVADSLRQVVLCACGSGADAHIASPLGSLAQAAHRLGVPSVIAFRFPVTVEGATAATGALYKALFAGLSSLEDAHLAAQSALLERPSLDWAALQLLARAEDGTDTRPVVFRPYRGLLAYGPEHRRFFFGRDAERQELLAELDALWAENLPRFQVVEGASGSGKSSLVLSGVVPALLERGWAWARLVPGADPMVALEAALAGRAPGADRFLLVVDQFEEVFTAIADSAEGRALAGRFVQSLWALACDPNPVHVICTLRADFRGRCGEVHLAPALRMDQLFRPKMARHHLFVAQMGPDQLREVIARPAAAVGLDMPPDLVDRALADVGAEPGALPLLAYTLDLLWQRREGRRLRGQTYTALGGVSGALSGQAEAVFAGFGPSQQKAARRLLVRLVGAQEDRAQNTRRRVVLAELRPREPWAAAAFDAVLGALVDARLLVRTGEGDPTVEVAHEALIRSWPRLLSWIEEDRGRLAELDQVDAWAAQWEQFPAELLEEDALGYARQVRERYPGELSARAELLVRESQAAALRRAEAAARKMARARRRAQVGVAVAALVALVVSGLGLVAWRKSRELQDKNEDMELLNSRFRQRTRLATTLPPAPDPAKEVALLRDLAEGTRPEDWVQRAVDALRVPVEMDVLQIAHDNAFVRLSPDGHQVLAVDNGGRAWLYARPGDAEPVAVDTGGLFVSAATFSADGGRLLLGTDSGAVRIVSINTPGETTTLAVGGGAVQNFVVPEDGSGVALLSADHTLRVWRGEMKGDPLLLRPPKLRSDRFGLAPGSATAISVWDRDVTVWDLDEGTTLTLRADSPIRGLRFSPNGQLLATGHEDGALRIWSLTGTIPPLVLLKHAEMISALAFSPDGAVVAAGGAGDVIRILRVDGVGDPVQLIGHSDGVSVLEFLTKDRLLSASYDGTARIWRTDRREEPTVLRGHEGWVLSATTSRDGATALTEALDGTARLWDLRHTGSPVLQQVAPDTDLLFGVSLSPDGSWLLARPKGQPPAIWPVGGGEPRVLMGHEGMVLDASFSSDGAWALTAGEDGTARVWPTEGGASVVLHGHREAVFCARFVPDGRRVLTGSGDGTGRVSSADGTGEPVVLPFGNQVVEVAWAPDGEHLALGSLSGEIRVWPADGQGEPTSLIGHTGGITSLEFSPDGSRLLSASKDGTARVWDWEHAANPIVHSASPWSLSTAHFSPDGGRVVTAGMDSVVRIYATEGGLKVELRGHTGSITDVVFSPDGEHILSTSMDGSGRLWPADGHGTSIHLRGHILGAHSAAFSADGLWMLTASDDGTAQRWAADLSPESLLERLWRVTASCLQPAERISRLGETNDEAETRHTACLAKVAEYRANGAYGPE